MTPMSSSAIPRCRRYGNGMPGKCSCPHWTPSSCRHVAVPPCVQPNTRPGRLARSNSVASAGRRPIIRNGRMALHSMLRIPPNGNSWAPRYGHQGGFNPLVIFSVVADLAQRQAAPVAGAVSCMKKLLAAKLTGYQRRPWGRSTGSADGFTNAIQDLVVTGLFKPGERHRQAVDFTLFAEAWQPPPEHGILT